MATRRLGAKLNLLSVRLARASVKGRYGETAAACSIRKASTRGMLRELPMFRKLIRERCCLIPADCYYEWKEMPVGKRRYCIRMEDESPFFIGGMWDVWHAKEEDRLYTFTVLTTFPHEVSGTVHDRMPIIVQPKDYRRWFDAENEDVSDMLATPPSEGWIA